jgi:hypothetical protein
MMRALVRIVAALAVAVVVVVGAGLFLPRTAEVTRSGIVDAPPAVVYAAASDLRRFGEWSPWAEFGPEVQTMFSGPGGAVGQTLSWISDDPELGTGTLTLTSLDPDRSVATRIAFAGGTSAVTMLGIEPRGQGASRVTWTFATDLGPNPLVRYVWVLGGARNMVADQLEAGLTRLAALAGRSTAAPAPISLSPPPPASTSLTPPPAVMAAPAPQASILSPLMGLPLPPPSLPPLAPAPTPSP